MRSILEAFPKLKESIRQGFWILLFYALLFLLLFSPALLSGSLIGPLDGIFYHQPFFYAKKVLWDTLLLSGYPMMADPQVMTWYPPAFLFSLLPGGWNLFIISAYVLASCFTYGYVYTLTASRLAGVLSGIVYGMSGFMVAQLDHAAIIHSAAWLPLIIWSLESLRRKPGGGWLAAGCLAIACSNFAGHSQIIVYSLLLAVAYSIVLGWRAPAGRWRFYFLAALMLALGIGLAAVQIVPTLELGSLSLRSKLSYEAFIIFSLPPGQIPMLIFPALFGGLRAYGNPNYFGEWNLIEMTGYMGLLPLMLAVVGLIAGRQRFLSLFWLCVGLLAFLLALGGATPLARITYQLPVLNLFRVPARHFFLLAFAVGVLSGMGIKAILNGKVTRELMWRTILFSAALMILCVIALHLTQLHRYAAQKAVTQPDSLLLDNVAVGVPLAIFFISIIILGLWHARPDSKLRSALILLAVLMDLGSFALIYAREQVAPKTALSPPASAARYRDELKATNQRMIPVAGVMSPRDALPPNLSRLWDVPSATIYGPLILSRVNQFLPMNPVGDLAPTWQQGSDQSLDLMAIRYVFTPRLQLTEELSGINWFAGQTELSLGAGCNIQNPLKAKIELPAPSGATKLAIVSLLGCATELADGAEVLRVTITDVSGKTQAVSLRAGTETSEWAHDCADVLPQIKHGRAAIFRSFPVERSGATCEGHEYLATLPLKETDNLKSIEFQWTGSSGAISIKRLSLIDERTGRSIPVLTSPGSIADATRWRHVEDIGEESVYENLRAMPRAWLVPEVLSVKSDEALRIIKSSSMPDGRAFDASRVALVQEPLAVKAGIEGAKGKAEVTSINGSNVEVHTTSASAAFLVLSDVYYPGWKATVDGVETHVYETDFALRGLPVPAGSHVVRFEFRPRSFYYGLTISLLSLLALAFVVFRLRSSSLRVIQEV